MKCLFVAGANGGVQLSPFRQHSAHRQKAESPKKFLRGQRHQRSVPSLCCQGRRFISTSEVSLTQKVCLDSGKLQSSIGLGFLQSSSTFPAK